MTAKPKDVSIYAFMSDEKLYLSDKITIWKSRVYGNWLISYPGTYRDKECKSFEEAIHYSTTGEKR